MKFARYLEDTQTPEWKKAYIDYRGLKKRITAVRHEQEGQPADLTPEHSSGDDPLLPNVPNRRRQEGESTGSDSAASPRPEEEEADAEDDSDDERPRVASIDHVTHQLMVPLQEPGQLQSTSQPNLVPTEVNGRSRADSVGTMPLPSQAPAHPLRRASTLRSFATRFRIPSFVGSNPDLTSPKPRLVHSTTMPHNISASDIGSAYQVQLPEHQSNQHVRTMREILPTLTPTQKKFFDKLDTELEKIESFYLDREKEAHERSDALKLQLHGLRDHRRAFYEAHPPSEAWTTAMSYLPFSPNRKADMTHAHVETEVLADHLKQGRNLSASRSRTRKNASKQARSPGRLINHDVSGTATPMTHASTSARPLHVQLANIMGLSDPQDGSTLVGKAKQRERFDPDEYTHAKKKLKKAVLEHYRMLELLNDYRILNITGFRKALKKFEKVTRLAVQGPYMQEKVETSSFASDDSVKVMLHDMEEQFAARFSRGDKKKAMTRLRGGLKSQRSHHPSTFRSGMLLGLAIPAFVDGIFKSYQPDTRAQIPGWDGLLFVYSILLIPTLFACLVGVNISVWAKSRINYAFIFDLNVRTALNKHQYMELPLFLLATLLYTFYLSFARIGAGHVDPTTWPLIWLLFAIVIMINPLPIFRRSARYWLLRNFGRLLVSGTRRVEFADFWMGDQFCSLVFSLSNIYFIGCVYTGGHSGDIGTESVHGHSKHFRFGEKWRRCTTPGKGSSVWALPFILAMLPLLVRFVQSVKRYADSKLLTHIINGGKYAMGIVYYACYYNWRHTGGQQGGVAFAFWVLFATVYACYAATWDYLMDWSLFKPHSRYPLLRPELLYSHKIVYYFAIVSNIIIRFIWVIYIPISGPNFLIRSFIAASLEMLRRWQWNFIRLENEHLGNMDQYRVTREVPLPYSVDDIGEDSAGEDDMDEEAISSKRSWRRRRSQSRAGQTRESDLNGAHA